jgi:hypothetical protein
VSHLLEVRGLTVELPELPTPSGWVRPVNEVSLRIAVGGAFPPAIIRKLTISFRLG